MKRIKFSVVYLLLLSLFFSSNVLGQTFGTNASAVWLSNCNQSNFYNTSGSGSNLIGPSGNVFTNTNLGAYAQFSGTLILRGAQVKTFKNVGVGNVCSALMYYRVYLQGDVPGSFEVIDSFIFDIVVISAVLIYP